MTVSVASFKVAFPEFAKSGDAMLEAQLALVLVDVSDSFGDSYDTAVMLRLADTLALSPWGRNARLITPKATTSTYGDRFCRLAEANGVSASRLGSTEG